MFKLTVAGLVAVTVPLKMLPASVSTIKLADSEGVPIITLGVGFCETALGSPKKKSVPAVLAIQTRNN